jgi:hypothetical protein
MESFVNNVQVTRCTTARTAATTDTTGSMITTAGFEGVAFMVTLGAVTAGSDITLTVKGGDSTNSTAATTLTPSAAVTNTTATTAGQGKTFILDIIKPQQAYLWAIVTIAAANCVVGDVYAMQYGPIRLSPVTQSTARHIYDTTIAIGPTT